MAQGLEFDTSGVVKGAEAGIKALAKFTSQIEQFRASADGYKDPLFKVNVDYRGLDQLQEQFKKVSKQAQAGLKVDPLIVGIDDKGTKLEIGKLLSSAQGMLNTLPLTIKAHIQQPREVFKNMTTDITKLGDSMSRLASVTETVKNLPLNKSVRQQQEALQTTYESLRQLTKGFTDAELQQWRTYGVKLFAEHADQLQQSVAVRKDKRKAVAENHDLVRQAGKDLEFSLQQTKAHDKAAAKSLKELEAQLTHAQIVQAKLAAVRTPEAFAKIQNTDGLGVIQFVQGGGVERLQTRLEELKREQAINATKAKLDKQASDAAAASVTQATKNTNLRQQIEAADVAARAGNLNKLSKLVDELKVVEAAWTAAKGNLEATQGLKQKYGTATISAAVGDQSKQLQAQLANLKQAQVDATTKAKLDKQASDAAAASVTQATKNTNLRQQIEAADVAARAGNLNKLSKLVDELKVVEAAWTAAKGNLEATQGLKQKYGTATISAAVGDQSKQLQAQLANLKQAQVDATTKAKLDKQASDAAAASVTQATKNTNLRQQIEAADVAARAGNLNKLSKLVDELKVVEAAWTAAKGNLEATQGLKQKYGTATISAAVGDQSKQLQAQLVNLKQAQVDATTKAKLDKQVSDAAAARVTQATKSTNLRQQIEAADVAARAGNLTKLSKLVDELKVVEAAWTTAKGNLEATKGLQQKYGTATISAAVGDQSKQLQARLALLSQEASIIARDRENIRQSELNTSFLQRVNAARMDAMEGNTRGMRSLLGKVAQVRAQLAQAQTPEQVSEIQGRVGSVVTEFAKAGRITDMGRTFELDPNGRVVQQAESIRSAFRRLSVDTGALHSSARGLASGFNLLWLTWGDMIPLLAGAAISMGVTQTVKLGKEFQTTLYEIQHLAGISEVELESLSKTMLQLGANTSYTAREAAEAAKILGLAGLKGAEVSQALVPTLQFASAGGVTADKAAQTLTAVGAAYAYTAKEYAVVADIIVKSSSDSLASVDSMAESFKTASVLAQAYGVSLKDTAFGLEALAQIGITGTSAGTSLRNMYQELTKTSGVVGQVMTKLKVSAQETTGEMRPVLDIIRDLKVGMVNLTGKEQTRLQALISNERGNKGLSAGMSAMDKVYKEHVATLSEAEQKLISSGKSKDADIARTNAMRVAYEKLKESTDESFKSAAGMSFFGDLEKQLTTEGLLKGLTASFENSLLGAFKQAQPVLDYLAVTLRETFNSETFQKDIANFITGVIRFGETILNVGSYLYSHKEAVGGLLAVYAAGKLGLLGLTTSLIASSTAFVASTLAIEGTNAATTALTAAKARAVAVLTSFNFAMLGAGGLVVGAAMGVAALAALAGEFFNVGDSAARAADKAREAEIKALQESVRTKQGQVQMSDEMMETEISNLEKTANEREQGVAAEVSAQRRLGEAAENRIRSLEANTRALKRLNAEQQIANYLASETGQSDPNSFFANSVRADLERDIATSMEREGEAVLKLQGRTQRLIELKQEEAAAAQKASEARRLKSQGAGLAEDVKGGRPTFKPRTPVVRDFDLSFEKDSIAAMQASADKKLAIAKSGYDLQREIAQASHDAGLVEFAQYQIGLSDLTQTYEKNRLAEIASTQKELIDHYLKTYAANVAIFNKEVAEFKGTSEEKLAYTQRLQQKFDAVVQQSAERLVSSVEKGEQQGTEITNEALKRRTLAYYKFMSDVGKVLKSNNEFWTQDTEASARADELRLLGDQYAYIGEASTYSAQAEKASAFAKAEAFTKYAMEAVKLAEELKKLRAQEEALFGKDSLTEEDAKDLANLSIGIAKVTGQLTEHNKKAGVATAKAASDAYEKVQRDSVVQLQNATTDAIMTGLIQGGQAGKRALRDIIMKELSRPIRMVVQALVNPVMGAVAGAFGMGSAPAMAGEAGGSLLSSAAGSVGSSLLGGSTLAGMGEYFATGFLNTVLAEGTGAMAGMAAGAGVAGGTAAGSMANGVAMQLGAAAPWLLAGVALLNALGAFRTTKKVGGGLEGTLGAGGQVNDYDLMRKSGTLFGGPDYSLQDKGISALNTSIQADWKRVSKATLDMATALGLSTDAAKNFTVTLGTDVLHPDTGGMGIKLDDLQGKNLSDQQYADEVNRRIGAALSAGSNELAQQILGSWQTVTRDVQETITEGFGDDYTTKVMTKVVTDQKYVASQYARNGEEAIDTLTRLASSLTTVNSAFELLGYSLMDSSLAGGDMASSLADNFGGLEAFKSATSNFFETFYTPVEKAVAKHGVVSKQLTKLGLASDTTVSSIRDLVKSQDLTTEAGQEMAASLMTLGPTMMQANADLLSSVGLVASDLASRFSEAVLSNEDPAKVGSTIVGVMVGSMEKALVENASKQIMDIMLNDIVFPMIKAQALGGVISETLTKASLQKMKDVATALANLFKSPEWNQLVADMETTFGPVLASLAGTLAGTATHQSYLTTATKDTGEAAQDTADELKRLNDQFESTKRQLNTDYINLQITALTDAGKVAEAHALALELAALEEAEFISQHKELTASQQEELLQLYRRNRAYEDTTQLLKAQTEALDGWYENLVAFGEAMATVNPSLTASTKLAAVKYDISKVNLQPYESALQPLKDFNLEELKNLKPDQIRAFLNSLLNAGDISIQTRNSIIPLGLELLELAEAAEAAALAVRTTFIDTFRDLYTSDFVAQWEKNDIATQLVNLGVSADTAGKLTQGSVTDLRDYAEALYNNTEVNDTTKVSIFGLVGALVQLEKAAEDSAKAARTAWQTALDGFVGAAFKDNNATQQAWKYQAAAQQLADLGFANVTAAHLTSASMQELVDAVAFVSDSGMPEQLKADLIGIASGVVALSQAADAAALTDISKNTDDLLTLLDKLTQKEKEKLEKQKETASKLVDDITSIFDTLRDAVAGLRRSATSTKRYLLEEARNKVRTAASTGVLPTSAEMGKWLEDINTGLDAAKYSSVAEADFARLVVAGELEKLQGVAGEQLTDAQKQLRALEDQITLLDKQLQAQHDAVDELRGVKLGLTTIESVMSAIHASLIAESAIRQAQTSSAASLSAANLSRPSSLPTTAPVNKFGAATGTRGFFASPLSNYRQISTTEFIDGNGKTRSISGLPLSMETLITASDITGDLQPVIDAARSAGLTPAQVAQAYQQLGRDNTTETSLADWARNTGVVWPELRAATSSWDTTTNTGTLDGQGFSSATAVSTLQDILVNQGVAAAFDAARSTGFSREELSSMVGISQADLDAVADANGIPRLAVGTDYVPRDMFALLHEGERVVPKRYNPSATGESEATHTDPALLLAIKVLIDRVDNLTYQTKRSADAVNGRGEMPQLVKNV